jgi:hypothetical protein
VAQRIRKDRKLALKVAALGPAQANALPGLITSKADGNLQYVYFLLNAAAARLHALDNPSGLPSGLDVLYSESLARVVTLGKKDWATVYKPFLGVLSVAQAPLTLSQVRSYASLPIDAFDVLIDLSQFIEATPGTPPATAEEHAEDRYRLYHQSMIDFLRSRQLTVTVDGQRKSVTNIYNIAPEEWHRRIVAYVQGQASEMVPLVRTVFPLR